MLFMQCSALKNHESSGRKLSWRVEGNKNAFVLDTIYVPGIEVQYFDVSNKSI